MDSSPNNSKPNHTDDTEDWTVLVRVGDDQWRIASRPERSTVPGPAGEGSECKHAGTTGQDTLSAFIPHSMEQKAQRKFIQPFSSGRWDTTAKKIVADRMESLLTAAMELFEAKPGWRTGRRRKVQRNTHAKGRSARHNRGFISGRASPLPRKVRDGLELGGIVGLVLGCLSLFLFHLLAPLQAMSVGSSSGISQPVPTANSSLQIPAFQVYSVKVGAFGTHGSAAQTALTLEKRGLDTVLVQMGGQYVLYSGVSLSSSGLQSALDQFRSRGEHATVVRLAQTAQQVPAASGAQPVDMRILGQWLDETVSSLNTMTGAESNGEPKRDAQVAYQAAQANVPAEKVFQESSYSKQFITLKTDMEQAYAGLQHGKHSVTARNVLQGYLQLLSLHGEG